METRTLLPIALLAACLAGGAQAQPAERPARLEAARRVLDRALDGDSNSARDAAARFRGLATEDPADPVALAYLGSATTLLAKHAWFPWTKVRHVETGLDDLDRALAALEPGENGGSARGEGECLEVRLVAATTFLSLPVFFNRQEKGRVILGRLLSDPMLRGAPTRFQASVHYWAGRVAGEQGDGPRARVELTRAVALDPDGRDGGRARELLKAGEPER